MISLIQARYKSWNLSFDLSFDLLPMFKAVSYWIYQSLIIIFVEM